MAPRAEFVSANVYGHNRSAEQLRQRLEETGAVGIGGQEAFWLGHLVGYRRLCGDQGRGALEVPIYLRRDVTYLGHGAYKAKRDLGTPITPERWVTWARFRVGTSRRMVLINTHLDAALQNRDTGEILDAPRVDYAEGHMRMLAAEVRRQRRDGFLPFVTGDFNYFRRRPGQPLWRWSPQALMPRLDVSYHGHRLDGVGVPRGVAVLEAGPIALPGSDHDGVSVAVELPAAGGRE